MAWHRHLNCYVIAALIAVGPIRPATADTPQQNAPAQASFSDLVEMVKQNGWRINLGDLCAQFGISQRSTDCFVQQISVEEVEGLNYPRGFNVPISVEPSTDILLYHLNPMVGEFFVASRDGALKAAFLRSKGTGYESVALDVVRDEFQRDVAYWLTNLDRVKRGLESKRLSK